MRSAPLRPLRLRFRLKTASLTSEMCRKSGLKSGKNGDEEKLILTPIDNQQVRPHFVDKIICAFLS